MQKIALPAKISKACTLGLGKDIPQHITLAHADVDVCRLAFKVVPVFVFFYKGEAIHRMEGANTSELKKQVKELIKLK